MPQELLSCNNLSYHIGFKKILKNVSFRLYENELISLVGDNGSGKSSLLKLILSHKKYTDTFQWKVSSPKRQLISYLGHEPGLYSSLSLKENLSYLNGMQKILCPEVTIHYYLQQFNLQKRYLDPIHEFSRGMKQKAGLIRSFISKPLLLLLDEPFSGLDRKSVQHLVEILKEVKKESTVILVTHHVDLIESISNRTFYMKSGELTLGS